MSKAIASAMFALCASLCSPCWAGNPVDAGYPYRAVQGGVNVSGILPTLGTFWDATDAPWDGKYTSEGSKYSHGIPGADFPFTRMGVTHTAAETDAYWDGVYGTAAESGATFAKNCHGYSTGKGDVINIDATGIGVILGDEYVQKTLEETIVVGSIIVSPDGGHSIRVDSGCDLNSDYNYIKQTHEKNGSSGVYKLVYSCPGGSTADPYSAWEKKGS